MDFYNRTSLTAYCTAFAYRPLARSSDAGDAPDDVDEPLFGAGGVYLELPADTARLYQVLLGFTYFYLVLPSFT